MFLAEYDKLRPQPESEEDNYFPAPLIPMEPIELFALGEQGPPRSAAHCLSLLTRKDVSVEVLSVYLCRG
jgi:hypothetical protein